MTREEVVSMMVEKINDDNRAICNNIGMSEADIEAQIEQSRTALIFMCNNLYDLLKEKAIIS